jgi:hypothetical protein
MRENMGLKVELKTLVDELDRTHGGAAPWSTEAGIPDFVTAKNGRQRSFTRKAREALWQFSKTLFENRERSLLKIELADYEKIVRQAVADMHAADEFLELDENDQKNIVPKLKSLVEDRIASIISEYTHYFPAWTLGMETESQFKLGPVTFLSRFDWIDLVDFPQQKSSERH